MRLQQIHRIVDGDGDTTKFTIRGSMELNVGVSTHFGVIQFTKNDSLKLTPPFQIITSCLPFLRPVLGLLPRRLLACFSSDTSSKSGPEPGFNPIATIGGGVSYQRSPIPSSNNHTIGNHSAISSKAAKSTQNTTSSLLSSFQSRPRSPEPAYGLRNQSEMMSVMKTVHVEVDSVQAPPSPTLWLAPERGVGEFGRGKTRKEVWEYG